MLPDIFNIVNIYEIFELYNILTIFISILTQQNVKIAFFALVNTPQKTHTPMQNEKDITLCKLARKRLDFKRHLLTYLTINVILWILWLLNDSFDVEYDNVPLPAWLSYGWGIAIVLDYYNTYVVLKGSAAVRISKALKHRPGSRRNL